MKICPKCKGAGICEKISKSNRLLAERFTCHTCRGTGFIELKKKEQAEEK